MTPFDLIGDLWLEEYDATVRQIRRLGVVADAEDVTTEVFLELASLIAAGRQDSDPEGLRHALRIRAAARARDAHRAAGATERLVASLQDIAAPGPVPAPRPDSFLASTLDEALREQPRLLAQAFIAVVLRGASADEVAGLLNVHRATVYRWVDDVADDIARRLTP